MSKNIEKGPFLQMDEIEVKVEDLCLDPKNPRIPEDARLTGKFEDSEIAKPELQELLFGKMMSPEFDVRTIVQSIRTKGFVNVDSIIVRRLVSSKKFLVIEGNRRTTALKSLMGNYGELPENILKTLKTIRVKVLKNDNPKELSEEIDYLLGLRHHGGIKKWGPLQQARNIYETYNALLRERSNPSLFFTYDTNVAAEVAASFNISLKHVRKSLQIFTVFDQLVKRKYPVRPDHFSLLEMSISNRALSGEYFELDPTTFTFSDLGLERFNTLFLEKDCQVSNPSEFKALAYVFKNGTPNEMRMFEAGEMLPERIQQRIEQRKTKDPFLGGLHEAIELLQALRPNDFNGSDAERRAIVKLYSLLEKRFVSLL